MFIYNRVSRNFWSDIDSILGMTYTYLFLSISHDLTWNTPTPPQENPSHPTQNRKATQQHDLDLPVAFTGLSWFWLKSDFRLLQVFL